MKKYSVPFISAVAGSILTIALFLALGIGQTRVVKVDHFLNGPATKTLYAMDGDGEMVPLDLPIYLKG